MRRSYLLGLLSLVMALGVVVPDIALAQRRGHGYGYGAPQRPQYGFRHRLHGYVGGQLMGMGIVHQGLDSQYDVGRIGSGGGFGLFGGVRLGPFVSLELNWTYTAHDQSWYDEYSGADVYGIDFLQVQTVTGDAKIHIPTRGRIEPFVQGGIGVAFLGFTGGYGEHPYIFSSGPAFNLGGGVDLWLSPWFTLGGRLLYRGMYFGESDLYGPETAGDNYVSGLSVDFNAQIHF